MSSALLVIACETGETGGLGGMVKIDGSSTVYPITEAVAEEFLRVQPHVRVTVGVSGTGGGFKKFTAGETDVNNASRPIISVEQEAAAKNGVELLELPVALDGLAIMVHLQNDFVDYLTVEELRRIWQPGSDITRWNQIHSHWPDREIALYGPGTDSGSFDYFTETIMGERGATRPDFTASEDDNVLVRGIAGDRNSLGYLGYAYYIESKDIVKLVPIDGGDGPVLPTNQTVNDGTYQPLTRPLFIYVNTESLKRPEVLEYIRFYLSHAGFLATQVGYVALPQEGYTAALAMVEEAAGVSIVEKRAEP